MLQQNHCRHAAVVVPDHVRDFGGVHRIHHGFGFGGVAAEGLFAEHHFAGGGGCDRDLVVGVVRASDIDDVDVFAVDQFAPVGFDGFVTPVIGEGFGSFGISCTDGFQAESVREVEEDGGLPIGVGVGASHEAVTYQSDV